MKPNSIPDFQQLNLVLSQTSQELHPSQVHGVMAGVLCGQTKNKVNWEELVTQGEDSAKLHEILQSLFAGTKEQLHEFLFEFQLVLPPEEEGLPSRAEALTLWCQGYLTGLKLAGVKLMGHHPDEEVGEAIKDLVEIAKMNYEEVAANEEDEGAYVELVEYVRMAVILIYQDNHEEKEVKNKNGSARHFH